MFNRIFITLLASALVSITFPAMAGKGGDASSFEGKSFFRTVNVDQWRLSFGDDGSLRVFLNGEAEALVTYTVSANEIELVDVEGSCTGDEATGVYAWDLASETLTMTAKSDRCDRRRGVLTGDTWTAVE